MKRSLKVLLVALFLSLFVLPFAVNCLGLRKAQSADPIQTIRLQYAAINKRVGRYKKVKKELSGFSLEGGQMIAYFDGPEIAKIVATHYGEGGRTLEEHYYANAKLIFVFQREQRYDRPLSGKVVRTQENRFYFANDRLIRWINEEGKPVPLGSDEYQEKQVEFLETSGKFLEGARAKAPTIEA
jgi:hypothetical protein